MNSLFFTNINSFFVAYEMIFGGVGAVLLALGNKRHSMFLLYIIIHLYAADQFINFGAITIDLYQKIVIANSVVFLLFCILFCCKANQKNAILTTEATTALFVLTMHVVYLIDKDFIKAFISSLYGILLGGIIFSIIVLFKIYRRKT